MCNMHIGTRIFFIFLVAIIYGIIFDSLQYWFVFLRTKDAAETMPCPMTWTKWANGRYTPSTIIHFVWSHNFWYIMIYPLYESLRLVRHSLTYLGPQPLFQPGCVVLLSTLSVLVDVAIRNNLEAVLVGGIRPCQLPWSITYWKRMKTAQQFAEHENYISKLRKIIHSNLGIEHSLKKRKLKTTNHHLSICSVQYLSSVSPFVNIYQVYPHL